MRHRAAFEVALVLMAVLGVPCAAADQQMPAPAAQSSAPAAPQPPASTLGVAAGERLLLELESALHTRNSRVGERVLFHTTQDILVGSEVALPRDTKVQATVTKVRRPGRLHGRAEIRLRFQEITLADGTTLPLAASIVRAGFTRAGKSKEGEPQIKGEAGSGGNISVIAQGGVQGAVIGIATGSVKAAGYGAAVGAAIGLASILLERGPELDLPRTTMFELRIDKPIQVPIEAAQRASALGAQQPSPPAETAYIPAASETEIEDRGDVPRPVLRRRPQAHEEVRPPVWPSTEPADAPATLPPDEPATSSPDIPATAKPDVPAAAQPDVPAIAPPIVPPASPPAPAVSTPVQTSGFKLSVDVKLVIVEAVVRDRGGRILDGLAQKDFRVFENGSEQKILDFSRDELPLAVALVIDCSGSVAPYMPELRDSANRALSQLKRGDQVALFSFSSEVQRLEELTTDRQRVADRIAEIRGGGGTNIVDAIFEAVHYLGMVAPDRRRAVVLVSDNQGTTRPRASEASTIRMALETETSIYSIKTPGEPIPITLRLPNVFSGTGSVSKMTRETGGEIFDASGMGGVGAALETALSRLRLRYTIGYAPSEPFRDAKFRTIDVSLAERFGKPGGDYTVYARRGYYPPQAETAARTPER